MPGSDSPPGAERPSPSRPLAVAVRAVELLARVVPGELRVEWANEWKAELWYLARALEQRGVPQAVIARELLRSGAGALRDAAELRLGAPDEWHAALRAAVVTLRKRPVGTTAAVGILVVAIVALTPVLLLSPIVLHTLPASTVMDLTGPTLIVSLTTSVTIALLASASHAARALTRSSDASSARPGRPRLAEALILACAAGLPGAGVAMLATARLHPVLAAGPGVTSLATAALSLATFALLTRS